jgi:GT2 family glycosyltransferase
MVSIIIVNYNGRRLILDCLKSLERQSFADFEVIIVDNGSLDGSLAAIQQFSEETSLDYLIRIIPLGRNLGFAGGNVEGLRYADGKYIALLNNDTEPDERWLEELVKAMESDPVAGICASKLIVYGTDIIDSAGDGFSTALKGFKNGEGEKVSFDNGKEYVFGACAGAALYRREMIKEIGFLDEDFFSIYEDTDLNLRAQLHGWKVMYVPTAIVYHKVRSTIGSMSKTAIYYALRNSEFVRFKNIPVSLFLRFMPEFILGMVAEFTYFVIKHRHPILYFKAKIDAMRMLPRILSKRAIILKKRKVSDQYLFDIMTPVWEKDFMKGKIKKFLYE